MVRGLPLRAAGEKTLPIHSESEFRPWLLLLLPAIGALASGAVSTLAPETSCVRVAAKASEGGSARDMVTRFMGLIVLSMGVQFALTGLHKFWT